MFDFCDFRSSLLMTMFYVCPLTFILVCVLFFNGAVCIISNWNRCDSPVLLKKIRVNFCQKLHYNKVRRQSKLWAFMRPLQNT